MAKQKTQSNMVKSKPRILRPKQELQSSVPQPQQMLLLLPQNLNGGNLVLVPQSNLSKGTVPSNPIQLPVAQKPYFRSVKGYVSDKKEVGNICRTCYRAIFNHHYIKLYDDDNQETSEKLRQMLKHVIPHMDIEIYANPIMCTKCVKLLFSSYEFQTKCHETEQKFNSWILQRKGVQNNDVNLLILVESSTDNDDVDEAPKDVKPAPKPPEPVVERTEEAAVDYINMDHDYISTKTVTRVKKKYSYKVKLSGEAVARHVKPKRREKLVGPFLCDQCGEVMTSYRNFKIHSLSHGTDGSHSVLRKLLQQKTVSTYKCKDCGQCFPSVLSLKLHFRSVHMKQDLVQCHICGRSFRRASLKLHLISHNPEQHLRYTCDTCDKKFAFKQQYVSHLLTHGSATYMCELCGKKLKSKANLRRHVEFFHENKNKYRCEDCFRGYCTEEELVRHRVRVHENGNLHMCAVCGDAFPSQIQYNRHLQRHREKTYECNVCGKLLKYAKSFNKHYEIFHGNKGRFKCQICDKGYWKQEDLLKHEFKVHSIEAVEDDVELYQSENEPHVELENEMGVDGVGMEFEDDETESLAEFVMDKENVLVERLEAKVAKPKRAHKCAAVECKNSTTNSTCSFFRFPKEPDRFQMWAFACGRRDLVNKIEKHANYRMCAEHFEDNMFVNPLKCRLHFEALPTKNLSTFVSVFLVDEFDGSQEVVGPQESVVFSPDGSEHESPA